MRKAALDGAKGPRAAMTQGVLQENSTGTTACSASPGVLCRPWGWPGRAPALLCRGLSKSLNYRIRAKILSSEPGHTLEAERVAMLSSNRLSWNCSNATRRNSGFVLEPCFSKYRQHEHGVRLVKKTQDSSPPHPQPRCSECERHLGLVKTARFGPTSGLLHQSASSMRAPGSSYKRNWDARAALSLQAGVASGPATGSRTRRTSSQPDA